MEFSPVPWSAKPELSDLWNMVDILLILWVLLPEYLTNLPTSLHFCHCQPSLRHWPFSPGPL